jgi:hypothetical protein
VRFDAAGDAVMHGWDLMHGVRVTRGGRFSMICWFKDSEAACLSGTTPW